MLLVAVTFGVSLLIYELIVKRYNATRLLFGMRLKQKRLPFPGSEIVAPERGNLKVGMVANKIYFDN